MATTDRLEIRNFAQIAEADLTFGDLTVLVGAQATGKSLALQWLKLAMDGKQVVTALHDAGHPTEKPDVLVDLVFGTGMSGAWTADSGVTFNRKKITPKGLGRIGDGKENLFFIPAVPKSQQLQTVATAALGKEYRVHHFAFDDDGLVRSTDISTLDPGSENEAVAGWGGLTEFSSRFGDAVRQAANDND